MYVIAHVSVVGGGGQRIAWSGDNLEASTLLIEMDSLTGLEPTQKARYHSPIEPASGL